MKVKDLIKDLKRLNQDAYVWMLSDGELRTPVDLTYMGQAGDCVIAGEGEPGYSDCTRPEWAPTASQCSAWRTSAEDEAKLSNKMPSHTFRCLICKGVSLCECQMKEANKYQKEIRHGVHVDVYDVLKAFEVECPAMQHAIKKMLCSGQRGVKSVEQDKLEAMASIRRSIELDQGVEL